MTDLEPLLRQHFSAEADRVSLDANLVGAVDGLRRTRHRRRVLVGSATLGIAVLVAAVAVPLALVGQHGAATRLTVSPNQPAIPAKPPAGERGVTWAGIQFYVPATWPSVAGVASSDSCARSHYRGGVVGYQSDVPVAAVGCVPAAPPRLEQLQFATVTSCPAGCPARPQPSKGQLAGLPAFYTRTTSLGQQSTFVQVPSRGAVFMLTTNTPARTDDILASAHQVSVDENGCAVDQPADLEKVDGGGAGGAQVRGTPVSGVVCSYTGRRLVMGVRLSPKELATVTADLDRLPARYTAAELRAQQAGSVLDRGGLASIRLSDAHGRIQQVTVQGPLPGIRPGVAGATQSTLTQALSADLSDALPSGFGANAFATGPSAELPTG